MKWLYTNIFHNYARCIENIYIITLCSDLYENYFKYNGSFLNNPKKKRKKKGEKVVGSIHL